MMEPGDDTLWGLLAEYEDSESLLHAAGQVAARGYRRVEACTPVHVAGLDEALGHPRTYIGRWILGAGVVGCLTGVSMQVYATCYGYPLNVGGRPWFSWPSYLAISFELTVLFAAIWAVLGMLAANGLPRLYHPLFNVPDFARASKDRYFLVVEAADDHFDPRDTRALLLGTDCLRVHEVKP